MEINAATKYAVRTMLRAACSKAKTSYVSKEVQRRKGEKKTNVIRDHAIPLSVMLDKIYSIRLHSTDELLGLVNTHSVTAEITSDEDKQLHECGINRCMPKNWDGKDVLARYQCAGIELSKIH
jgi:hypothetical protein